MSTEFKDSQGRPWLLRMTVGAADRILENCQIDLYDDQALSKAMTDPRLKLAAVCAALLPDMNAKNVSAADFRDALDGDSMFAAIQAFDTELVNFCPAELRATRQAMLAKARELVNLQAAKEREILASGQLERAIQAELKKITDATDARLAKLSGNEFGSTADASA